MDALGQRVWVLPAGHVPLESNGREPELTSHQLLAVLNTGRKPAKIELWIHHTDSEPVGPYRFDVEPRRVRRVRINDLIDPLAVPLGVDYALLLRSSVPVVVQFTTQDTGAAGRALMGTLAFPA